MRAYNEAKAAAVLDLLRVGTALTEAIKQVANTVGPINFGDWHYWLNTDEGRAADLEGRYIRAREVRAHLLAEEIVTLADSATPENAHVVRLQVDARKWVASKLMPKAYSDRLSIDSVHRTADPREMSTAELVSILRQQQAADAETRH